MLYDHLKQLYDSELWSNVCQLGTLTLNRPWGTCDPWGLSGRQRLQVSVMVGDALLKCQEVKRAEEMLKQAMQIKKHMAKNKKGLINLIKSFHL